MVMVKFYDGNKSAYYRFGWRASLPIISMVLKIFSIFQDKIISFHGDGSIISWILRVQD